MSSKLKSRVKSEFNPTPEYRPTPKRVLPDVKVDTSRADKRKRGYERENGNHKSNHAASSSSSSSSSLSMVGHNRTKGRTAVFSGHSRVNSTLSRVLSLEESCLRVLMENVDKLSYVGDVPYFLIKPVLQKCHAKQLRRIENLNPHLTEDSDELWMAICQKEFKGREPEDSDETWKDVYWNCVKERDVKLNNIARHINAKSSKDEAAIRKTQKVYYEKNEKPKPPKEVRGRQERAATQAVQLAQTNKMSAIKPKAPLMRKCQLLRKSIRR